MPRPVSVLSIESLGVKLIEQLASRELQIVSVLSIESLGVKLYQSPGRQRERGVFQYSPSSRWG